MLQLAVIGEGAHVIAHGPASVPDANLTPAAFIRATLRSMPRKVAAARSTLCAVRPLKDARMRSASSPVVHSPEQRVVQPVRRRRDRCAF